MAPTVRKMRARPVNQQYQQLTADGDERVEVPDADSMDDHTFIQHMNARHTNAIGKLIALWLADVSTMKSWRCYHSYLHSRLNSRFKGVLHTHEPRG